MMLQRLHLFIVLFNLLILTSEVGFPAVVQSDFPFILISMAFPLGSPVWLSIPLVAFLIVALNQFSVTTLSPYGNSLPHHTVNSKMRVAPSLP